MLTEPVKCPFCKKQPDIEEWAGEWWVICSGAERARTHEIGAAVRKSRKAAVADWNRWIGGIFDAH